MKPRSMELLRKKDDSGVNLTGTLSDFDICQQNRARDDRA